MDIQRDWHQIVVPILSTWFGPEAVDKAYHVSRLNVLIRVGVLEDVTLASRVTIQYNTKVKSLTLALVSGKMFPVLVPGFEPKSVNSLAILSSR